MQIFKQTLPLVSFALLCAVALTTSAFASDPEQLFGSRQSNFHPSLQVSEAYTDNYRQVERNEESEWTTTISPQILLSLPGIDRNFSLTSLNVSPGGAAKSHFMGDAEAGFQGVALYRADLEYNKDNSEDDGEYHSAQGLLQYAFPFGLTLEVSDVYTKNYDDFSEAGEERADYDDNRIAASSHYKVGEKLSLQLGYADYRINYDSSRKSFEERKDKNLSMLVFYQVMPKTQLFLEYQRIDVDYDQDIISDYTSDNYFVGLRFDATARIQGYVKVGYGEVDPDQSVVDSSDETLFEGRLNYQFGGRSNLALTGRRQVEVTVDEFNQDVLATEGFVTFSHQLTHKLQLVLDAGLREEEYRYDGSRSDRTDDITTAGVALNYDLRDWLDLALMYDFVDRDSDVVGNDYQSNTVTATIGFNF